jgi:aryl-alcohol dehydrogenase-like predicted oxidoreductase
LAQQGVTSVIIGAKTVAQVQDNLAATALVLTETELAQLNAISALMQKYPAWMMDRQGGDRFVA